MDQSTPTPPTSPASRRDLAFLGAFALLKLLIHLPVLHRYGFHHDELYFLACGQRLAWGYVDHAPLVPWIARLADELVPGSLVALRLPATLAGASVVLLAGLLARRLGGGRWAQALTCLAVMVPPVYLRTGNMLHLPSFELLWWTLAAYLVVVIVQEERQRLWLAVGAVAGLGLLTKHSMLFFGFGLVVGLLATPQRRQLRSPWLWAGGAMAGLFFLPNLLWQASHGWPTIEFLRQLNAETMAGIAALQFVAGQFVYLNPVTAPIWVAGLLFFLRGDRGRSYRLLGWLYVAVFLLLLVLKSKIYYLAPAYPPLLAGGAVVWERLAVGLRRGWLRPALASLVVTGGLALAPLSLPILPLEATERYIGAVTFGAFDNVYELTADLRGMFAWRQRAELVAEVWNELPVEERRRAVVLGRWYGPAAAIDYFGRELGLPTAVSPHLTYHLWGLPDHPIDTVVTAAVSAENLEQFCGEVTIARRVELPRANPWESPYLVAVCRQLEVDLHEAWPRMRSS